MQKSHIWGVSLGFLILGTLTFQYSIASTKDMYKVQKIAYAGQKTKESDYSSQEENSHATIAGPVVKTLTPQEEKIKQKEIQKIEKRFMRFEKKQKEKIRKIERQLSRAELKLKGYQTKIENLTKRLNAEKEKLTKELEQKNLKINEDKKVLKK